MRRLMLLRHAKSFRTPGVRDHERPLAARGKAAAEQMALHMRAEGLMPDAVIVSTALRTQETWAAVKPFLTGENEPQVVSDFRVYEAQIDTLLSLISEAAPHFKTLLVIGHNPGMSELAVLSAEPMRSDRTALATAILKFPAASLAVIDFKQEHWTLARRTGKFWRFVTPAMLGGQDED